VHIWAFNAATGAATFVGAAAYGVTRSDVGAVLGGQFTGSGYLLAVTGLPSGQTFDLGVYPHSTVSGTFNQSRVVRVTIR